MTLYVIHISQAPLWMREKSEKIPDHECLVLFRKDGVGDHKGRWIAMGRHKIQNNVRGYENQEIQLEDHPVKIGGSSQCSSTHPHLYITITNREIIGFEHKVTTFLIIYIRKADSWWEYRFMEPPRYVVYVVYSKSICMLYLCICRPMFM